MKITSFRVEISLVIIGSLVVLTGIVCNEWVIAALFSPDGVIESLTIRLKIWLFDVLCVSGGTLVLIYRGSPRLQTAVTGSMAAIVSIFITLVIIDNVLYFSSPYLPANIARLLSQEGMIRHGTQTGFNWIYDENIHYAKPNAMIDDYFVSYKADENGYRNPGNYFTENNIDIVLLGDSFTWGNQKKTIADYMREHLYPCRVYSAGMVGEGIPHWKYHYTRLKSINRRFTPSVVVMNFYGGNDIRDTVLFLKIKKENKVVDSMIYSLIKQFGRQEVKKPLINRLLALSELRYMLRHIVASVRISGTKNRSAIVKAINKPYTIDIGQDPSPERMTNQVLNAIVNTIGEIRRINSNTIFVLSYIPTSGTIYGGQIENCYRKCEESVSNQKSMSNKLKDLSELNAINYLDFTAILRERALKDVLWARGHFSDIGYEIYSTLVSKEIRKLLTQSECLVGDESSSHSS